MSGIRNIHICILLLFVLVIGCDSGSGDGPECRRDDDCPECHTCHIGECQPAEEICGDGIDNDCDQAIDYEDDECTLPTPKLEVCVRVDASDRDNPDTICTPPHQLDFGQAELAPLGEPVSTPVILRNIGDGILTVQALATGAETSSEFSLESITLPYRIPAVGPDGVPDGIAVEVRYLPVDGGVDEGILEISSDDPDAGLVQVRMTGSGLAPKMCFEPTILDFGGITVGHTIRRNVALTNCGLSTLTVGQIGFLEPTSPEFTFGALPLTPFDLAPEEGVEIPIFYTPADLGSDNYEMEFTLSLLESERDLLREIDDALEKIAQGVYGICEGTGEPIPRTRLKFEPWTRYTVEYANLLEKGLVHRNPSSGPEKWEDDFSEDD